MHAWVEYLADLLLLSIVIGIPLVGYVRKIRVFDVFVEGGAKGFELVIKILPTFIAMIVAIGMLRASGFFDLLAGGLAPLLTYFHVSPDLVPLMLMRPFSGSGSNAILVDLIQQHGANSMVAHTAAVIIGSTETTFYVLAVYFGAVKVMKVRHAAISGLLADLVGILAAIYIGQHIWS